VLPTVAEVRSWDVNKTIEHLEETIENFTRQNAVTFRKNKIDGYACLAMTVQDFSRYGVGAGLATRIANYAKMIKQECMYLFKGMCFCAYTTSLLCYHCLRY